MKSLLRKEEGAFTLEASLLLPTVFLTVLILMFFCLYLYQNALSGQAAAIAAERAAFSWSNSSKDPRTGAYQEGKNDSLYWRLTDDALLQSIFGWGSSENKVAAGLPLDQSAGTASLALKKLTNTGSEVPSSITGRLVYSHDVLKRKIEADFARELPLSPLNKAFGGEWGVRSRASSYIVEPAEGIRTVELARYYTAKFRREGNSASRQAEAGKALTLFAK
ncbi:pilus assembly protein [Paenibacillus pinistramenti]|uniref:pilus assembly protein n=1 Tax=Paenibacillus pinistramenti TaxID=1768003 RepID=UPI0011094EA3|nr:pilus assembly protein [Paenibacillus pinistramenti]